MTTDLTDTLQGRAARADRPDLDGVLVDIRRRTDDHARRRRNGLAAGGGVVAVAALVTSIVAFAPGHRSASHHDAPGAGSVSSPDAPPSTGLVPIAAAPAGAEVSIGLVPAGWVLLGADTAYTTYGPPSLRGTSHDEFEGKLLVAVHERIGTELPRLLTVAGHPGDYQGDGDNQGVDITLDATTEVNIQVPPEAHLDRAAVLELANTLDVRGTAEKTHG